MAENFKYTMVLDVLIEKYDIYHALVFGRIWRYEQGSEKICYASLQTIADELNVSRRKVFDCVKKLKNDGLIYDLSNDKRNNPGITRKYKTDQLALKKLNNFGRPKNGLLEDSSALDALLKEDDLESSAPIAESSAPDARSSAYFAESSAPHALKEREEIIRNNKKAGNEKKSIFLPFILDYFNIEKVTNKNLIEFIDFVDENVEDEILLRMIESRFYNNVNDEKSFTNQKKESLIKFYENMTKQNEVEEEVIEEQEEDNDRPF